MDVPGIRRIAIYVALLLVGAGQGTLALRAFGGWSAVQDSRPLLSGRYPIHLHHGMLGAGHFAETWSTTCYDPDYQAGYLKTPIFDGGSRPTELTLLIASILHRPETDADSWSEAVRASKWGVVGSLLLIPILLAVAARGFGLRGPSLVLVATGSVFVTWSPVCRAMIDAGEIDLLLGGLCGVSLCGALADYHRNPGPRSWGVLALIIAGGWFFHPLIWLGFGPIAFAFYLGLAPRHGVAWHLGLWGSAVAGIIPNLVWLPDWCRYWWLRQPAADSLTQLPSPEELASTQGWSSVLTWEFAGWPMILVGLLGCAVMLKSKLRTPAWVLLTAIISSLLVAKFGLSWPGLAGSGVERVSTIAVVLALFPASVAVASLTERWKFGWLPPLAAAAMPLLCALDLPASRPVATAFSQNYELLPLGFSDDQEQFIQGVNRLTEPSARILIEERHEGSGADWNWTALLARRTGRAFLGGLDPEAGMEHLFCGLSRDRLNGRRLADVSDDDLHAFADRYNVGWVLCRSESSAARWRSTARVREVAQFRDHGPVTMFAIDRPHQYLVRGSGRLERADRRRIVLRDLEPDATGTATLAFHYQPGLRIMPPSVIAEREKDPFDPIPLIRLRLPGKVTRVTLFWERP